MSYGNGRDTLQLSSKLLKSRFLTTWQWLTALGFLISGVISCVVYAFTSFEMKTDHAEFEHRTDQRLVRMENKLDQLLLNIKKEP